MLTDTVEELDKIINLVRPEFSINERLWLFTGQQKYYTIENIFSFVMHPHETEIQSLVIVTDDHIPELELFHHVHPHCLPHSHLYFIFDIDDVVISRRICKRIITKSSFIHYFRFSQDESECSSF